MNPWLLAFFGGVLIGLSATVLLLFNGRIAGISGIFSGAMTNRGDDRILRIAFLLAMIIGATLYIKFVPGAPQPREGFSNVLLVAGGLIVGFGTYIGGGCTSGHGVCGLGRLSKRSLIAVLVFMLTAIINTYIVRHVLVIA